MKLRRVSAPQMAHILELPVELLQRIFRYVHPAQVVKYRRVCLRIFSALSTGAFARENLQMHPKLTSAGADKVSARAVKLLLRWPIEYQAAFAAFAQQAAATKMCCGWRRLDGAVPSALGDWPALTHLELQENKLRGELPIALGLLAGLRVLHLNGNSLSGAIPHELGRLEKLEQLHLNDNCLSGSIPDSLGQLCQLQSLYLNNNCLSGQLPPTLGKLNNLRALYLENNQIEGFIPLEWANMARLQIAYLGRNRLNPCLPSGFGRSTHIGEILRHQGFRCALQSSLLPSADFAHDPTPSELNGGQPFKFLEKSTRGRKKSTQVPSNKRTAQNREAQRNYHERKQAYIRGLEAKVAELSANIGKSVVGAIEEVPAGLDALQLGAQIEALKRENSQLTQKIAAMQQLEAEQRKSSIPCSVSASPRNVINVPCDRCASLENKSELYLGRIQALEMQVSGLQAECSSLRLLTRNDALSTGSVTPAVGIPSVADIFKPISLENPNPSMSNENLFGTVSDHWMDMIPDFNVGSVGNTLLLSATELYGKPEVEKTRAQLKSLSSLRNCKAVDRLLDLFVVTALAFSRYEKEVTLWQKFSYGQSQASHSSPKSISIMAIRIIAYFHKVVDATHVSERQKTLEFLTEFQEINKVHVEHLFNLNSNSADPALMSFMGAPPKLIGPEGVQETPQLRAFRNLAMSIPSLTGSQDLIDELFVTFWPKSSVVAPKQNFVRVITIIKLLTDKCETLQERMKVTLLIEIWRSFNKESMDELVEEIQDLSLHISS
ncbi:hypothetical protein HDU77_010620 [Chytriomyces hyalinus]|nr:hypothetical protein HDU77_010620 [Chytriomyces hyalinus]